MEIVIILSIPFTLGMLCGFILGWKSEQKNAVAHGVAEYYLDAAGDLEFRYLKK